MKSWNLWYTVYENVQSNKSLAKSKKTVLFTEILTETNLLHTLSPTGAYSTGYLGPQVIVTSSPPII